MRSLACLSLLLLLLSCNSPNQQRVELKAKDTVIPQKIKAVKDSINCDTSNWYKNPKDRDSVLVYEDEGSKSYYKKGELKRILASYPELDDEYNYNGPDLTYAKAGLVGKIKPCDADLLGCEVCQDDYYILYSYFLKQRNGVEKYKQERKKVIEIYRCINSIFGRLKGGGTYFGHQYKRILGYAEHAISLKKWDTENDYYNKQYDVSKQKKLYISELRQLITDDISINSEIDYEKKEGLKKELFETVTQIDGLITNYFYLKTTKEFQYSNY